MMTRGNTMSADAYKIALLRAVKIEAAEQRGQIEKLIGKVTS